MWNKTMAIPVFGHSFINIVIGRVFGFQAIQAIQCIFIRALALSMKS